jgi:protein involved in polysaccharide export with SLBB domain
MRFWLLWFTAAVIGVILMVDACGQDPQGAALATPVPSSESAPAAPTDGPADIPTGPNNLLHSDDLIRITVFEEGDLTTETRITKAGSITFPLLGSLQLAGKTIAQAQEEIRSRLDKDYIINPHVTIAVIEYSKLWVTVLGQVQKPGNAEIPAGGGLDLLGAIALTGGYTPEADTAHINIRRLVNGAEVVLTVNAMELARNPSAKPFMVQPGDAVTVPYVKKMVTILGEVQRPGEIELPAEGDLDVLGAVALAGGYTPDADPTDLDIRRSVGGKDTIITVNATELAQNSSVKPFLVQAGDSITVHYAKQWVTVLGEVQRPGKVKIPPEGGLDLLGAVALASGFSPDADIAHIAIRRTVDGKDVILSVNAKQLSRDANVESFIVQPGDSITVPQRMF